jgi:hypothetical protein
MKIGEGVASCVAEAVCENGKGFNRLGAENYKRGLICIFMVQLFPICLGRLIKSIRSWLKSSILGGL